MVEVKCVGHSQKWLKMGLECRDLVYFVFA